LELDLELDTDLRFGAKEGNGTERKGKGRNVEREKDGERERERVLGSGEPHGPSSCFLLINVQRDRMLYEYTSKYAYEWMGFLWVLP